MLRHLLGDKVFWEGVQVYVRRHTQGLVETSDFRKTMEEVRQAGRQTPLNGWKAAGPVIHLR